MNENNDGPSKDQNELSDEIFELSNFTNKKKNNLPVYIGGGVIAVLLIILTYYLITEFSSANEDSDDEVVSETDNEIKKKELELLEKELDLKEKELEGSGSDNSSEIEEPNVKADVEVEAANQVKKWINALGNGDYNTAYYLMDSKQRGSYSKFSSVSGYGGITSTSINNCYVDNSYGCSAEVVADYESIDPYNKSGRYKQRFFINNCDGYWKITSLKNISINYY